MPGFGQTAITIIWRRLMRGHGVFRKLFLPIEPFILICVILQAELEILFAAAAKDIDIAGRVGIIGAYGSRLAQNLCPEHLVQLPVAEMIRAGQITS